MKWDEELFNLYLDELQQQLFRNMNILEIIELAKSDNQARRLFNLHILKNREGFHDFYAKRHELGIQSIFDQVVAALFHEKRHIKLEIIELLGIEQEMIENKVEDAGLKEFNKDLSSFIMYWRKRRGDLTEELPQIKEQVKRYLKEMKDAEPH